MATVLIPAPLRDLTLGRDKVEAVGQTLGQLIADLDRQYPGLGVKLRAGDQLTPGLAAAIDGTVAHRGLFTPVHAAAEVHFLPAIAGG